MGNGLMVRFRAVPDVGKPVQPEGAARSVARSRRFRIAGGRVRPVQPLGVASMCSAWPDRRCPSEWRNPVCWQDEAPRAPSGRSSLLRSGEHQTAWGSERPWKGNTKV